MDIKVLIKNLKALNLSPDKFAVFGSGPLGIRGLREVPNLDIIVTDDVWEELINSGKYLLDEEGIIRTKGIKISNYWWAPLRKSLKTLIEEADIIDGIRFVRLEEVLAYKKEIMGEKEKKDIEIIEKYLASKKRSNE